MKKELTTYEPSQKLKDFTHARVALGHVGAGMPLREVLALKLAHAKAKDAIFTTLDIDAIRLESKKLGLSLFEFESLVKDRDEYLKRPDLGKKIYEQSIPKISGETNILFVLTDGLSAAAVNKYAMPLVAQLMPMLSTYKVSVAVVTQGRVAIGDRLCELFRADFVAVLIGERPGLSAPESMGIYTTYKAKSGFTDEKRNCISNVHQNGLQIEEASRILHFLIQQSLELKLSGVELKLDLSGIGLSTKKHIDL